MAEFLTHNHFPHTFENKYSQRNAETGLKVSENIMTLHYVRYHCKQKSKVEMQWWYSVMENESHVFIYFFLTLKADRIESICNVPLSLLLITRHLTLKTANAQ